MQPTTEILEKIRRASHNNKSEVFTRLYRYLLRPDLYYLAYKRLYDNNGAGTKGINDDTADGFSEAKVMLLIEQLKNETYQPAPVRRTYISKKNNPDKKRPLGIPTFSDKLVQEVLRMVLEAVYEPVFTNESHGFRPRRGCHTALAMLKNEFNGVRWFIEGDIKGCFDNINHAMLVSIIGKKIKDARIIKLVYKFLKAGYLENWVYHNTYSGTPQGGIISPLLANIYLHQLDEFVIKLKSKYDKPKDSRLTPEYQALSSKVSRLKKRITKASGEERIQLIAEYDNLRNLLLHTPCTAQTDKVLKYIRYADDFILGVKGSHENCLWLKQRISEFIERELKMEMSDEKTLITHSSQCARFLGYDVRVRRCADIRRGAGGSKTVKKRTLNNNTELLIPLDDKIRKFLFENRIVSQNKEGSMFPIHRKSLLRSSDLEIITVYNAELRGICNYYSLASNFHKLRYFAYLMEYSCLKTLAGKHKSSLSKILHDFKDGKGKWCIPYETADGIQYRYFANYNECRKARNFSDTISNAAIVHSYSINTLESRLKARVCELCGAIGCDRYELHHVNKLKNLKGKKQWEKVMIAKRRKTLVVCVPCHQMIHAK